MVVNLLFKNFKKRESNGSRIVDKKWAEIFDDYNVLDVIEKDGLFKISSDEIREYKEARLMTKFDYVSQLPDIFYNNHLTIMPTKRGEYAIGHFDAYYEYDSKITDNYLIKDRVEMPFPNWIESLDVDNITSESAMLNAAIAGNLLNDLLGIDENDIPLLTVDGRMSSLNFSFNIGHLLDSSKNYILKVENSQMEIDGGYETHDKLILIEAKNNVTDSFITRQLYYPFQRWAKEVEKEVIPIFLQYSNNTFNFSVFKFDDVHSYNSLQLIERKNYIFGAEHTTIDDLVKVAKEIRFKKEPDDIPTTQADTFARLYNLIDSIWESEDSGVSLEDVALENDFSYRQAGYYSNAARYLELIDKNDDRTLSLSENGIEFIKATRKERNLIIARQMLQYESYNIVFKRALELSGYITGPEAYRALVEANYYERSNDTYSESTRKRRAGTISSWVKHLFTLVDDY